MKLSRIMAMVIATVFLMSGCKGVEETKEKQELVILAAASLNEAMEEISQEYEKANDGVELLISYGASGTLKAQIEEGSAADIYFSADRKKVADLETKGLVMGDTLSDLLYNDIVLISSGNNTAQIKGVEDIEKASVSMIGIGEPKTVPAGKYAQEALESMGLWEDIQEKFNFGSDVKQVLSWVETGEVECGVVYRTDALKNDKITIVAEIPKDSHTEIVYPACVIQSSEAKEEAIKFMRYLKTNEAKEVFEKYGFRTKE